jgi:hypothetical protein
MAGRRPFWIMVIGQTDFMSVTSLLFPTCTIGADLAISVKKPERPMAGAFRYPIRNGPFLPVYV